MNMDYHTVLQNITDFFIPVYLLILSPFEKTADDPQTQSEIAFLFS